MKKALKRHGKVETIVTDGLRSYPAAMRELGNLDRREMSRWENNREQPSSLPTTRAGDAAIQTNEDAAEVRRGPRLASQPLQRRTPSH